MKDFLRYTLASMLGLLLFTLVATILGIISVAGMIASSNISAPVEKNSILRIPLKGEILEQAPNDPMTLLTGEEDLTVGLDELLRAIAKAKENENIKGIYIEGGTPVASVATLQEIRQALLDFKKNGKFVYAYADDYSQAGYYVSSTADLLMLNPMGGIDWHGLASEPLFFKDVLAKVGVKMQVFKVGTYKSAVEPFISTEMSDANREQVTSFLTSLWSTIKQEVGASRQLKAEELDALADSFLMLKPAAQLVEWRMADKLTYIDEVKDILRKKMELKDDESLTFISVPDMAMAESPNLPKTDHKIAVYYAYGDIVHGNGFTPTSPSSAKIVGSTMVDDLRALREDEDVKAVVIRVNSGGGSAYASEQIWREVELLKREKKVVVSMGGMAASGGYYIASGAHKILAEPTTLTGSIGIFGMIPDASELLTQKIGLKFDVVKTNALSDFGTASRGMNAVESRLIQAEVERGYEIFTGRVAQGRKMKQSRVKELGEGRVWTGEQALKNGLVDQLGNLSDAVKEAAKLAQVEDYAVTNHPTPEPWYSSLLNKQKDDYLESELRALLGSYYVPFSILQNVSRQDRIQMRLPYEPNIR